MAAALQATVIFCQILCYCLYKTTISFNMFFSYKETVKIKNKKNKEQIKQFFNFTSDLGPLGKPQPALKP